MHLPENNCEYAINAYTMMILPMEYKNKLYSRIIQLNGELHSPYKPTALIKLSCLANGCDFKGRVNGSRYILGGYQKVPIAINSENQMFFFPTTSPDQADCIWINPNYVKNDIPMGKKITFVTLKNNQTIKVPISHYIFKNQINKTIALQNKLIQINHEMKGNLHYFYQNNMKISERISDRSKSSEYGNSLNKRNSPEKKKGEGTD